MEKKDGCELSSIPGSGLTMPRVPWGLERARSSSDQSSAVLQQRGGIRSQE